MFAAIETRAAEWLTKHSTNMMRIALGIVFLWFGLLKFCPGLCDVEFMAEQTLMLLSFGKIPAPWLMHGLAIWECSMGLTLLFASRKSRWGKVALRLCVISLLMHLAGTFLPLVLFRGETWKDFPYAPTLAGQYILKNIVLMAGATIIGAQALSYKAQAQGKALTLSVVPAKTVTPIRVHRKA